MLVVTMLAAAGGRNGGEEAIPAIQAGGSDPALKTEGTWALGRENSTC